jgi:SpoVK/Ycf46/Vps4 family AAA+-type ATPase
VNENSNDNESGASKKQKKANPYEDNPLYKNIELDTIEKINNEILCTQLNVHWSDIAGLEDVKTALNEMIILPYLNPDIFTGLRQPPKGLLLFGPPGNGKTMIAKAVATEAKLTFFSISAAALTSKWMGEGEKMVKALFAVARDKQPSFIFIDEIDSILTVRGGSDENESTRRLKTEFLLQFDGAGNGQEEDRITVMGATNRPQDLDEAARRRLSKRIYVPLPEKESRQSLILTLCKNEKNNLSSEDFDQIAQLTEGYSGHDLNGLCKDAAMGPIREATMSGISRIDKSKLRALNMNDFLNSLKKIKPSVSKSECTHYEEWNKQFGSSAL